MTLAATSRRAGPFTGNGVTTEFPFSFKTFDADELQVLLRTGSAQTTLTRGVHYSVALNPDQEALAGGTITYPLSGAELSFAQQLIVQGAVPLDQPLDLPDGGNYRPDAMERALDRIVMQIQQLRDELGTALLPGSDSNLRLDLSNGADGALGAALVAYNPLLDYPDGSMGAAMQGGSSGLPTQTGNAGKTITTDGTAASWADIEALYGTVAGAGAVRRTMAGRFKDAVTVLDFIPEAEHATIRAGTSTYDCTAGIQAAINALGLRGGKLVVPRGTYEVSENGSNGYCLLITSPITLEGEGYFSNIKPKNTVGAGVDCILYRPNPLLDVSQSSISNLFLGDVTTGTRAGRYGIHLDTQVVNAFLPEITLRDLYIGQGADHAICHTNNAANNVNGGMYSANIEGCQLRGGIRLIDSGDSINILRNVISGTQIGIDAKITVGASQLHIVGNNITAVGGAIRLTRAARPHIIGNNIEQQVVGNGNSGAMINLAGTDGPIVQPIIIGNNMGAFTATGIVRCIRFAVGEGGLVQDNSFLPSSSTQFGIDIFSTWSHLRVGWNQYGTDSNFRVSDGGTGTMGVARSFQGLLQNGWVPHGSNYADCYYIKDHLGFVEIHGSIKDGTVGTLASPVELFTLPAEYRPAKSENCVCYSQDSGPTVQDAAILVNASAGTVFMIQGANGIFSFNARFRADQPALRDIRYGSGSNNYGHGAGHTSNY